MDAFNKDVGGNEQGFRPHLDDRHIITDPLDQCRIRRGYPFSDSIDEPELTNLSQVLFFCFQLRTLVRNGFKPCLPDRQAFPTEPLTLNSFVGKGDSQNFIHMFDRDKVYLFSNV